MCVCRHGANVPKSSILGGSTHTCYVPIFSPVTLLKPPRSAELQHIGLRQAQWHGLQALVLEAIEEVSLQWLAPARWPQLFYIEKTRMEIYGTNLK